jgi:hypothetical protein
MVTVHLQGPKWFFGADASLEAFAALIAFLVAVAALRVYRMTREKKYAYFTGSMILLTLSFLSRAVTDALLENIIFTIPNEQAGLVFFIGYVAHILLALTAYILLILVTHKITDKRVIALLFLIMVPSLLLSGSYFLSFYGLSAIFLAFISIAFYQNYRKVCKASACMVFLAFALLAIAQILFLVEAFYDPLYVAAHVTQGAGYLVLLFALVRTLLR